MKRCATFALLVCSLVLLFLGCASRQGHRSRFHPSDGGSAEDTENISSADFDARQREYNKERESAQDRHGLTLGKAQEKALALTPGMTEKAVKDLLDLPDETTAETEDIAAQPWQALVWTYRWHWSAFGSTSLEIRFRRAQNSWAVHTWHWLDR